MRAVTQRVSSPLLVGILDTPVGFPYIARNFLIPH